MSTTVQKLQGMSVLEKIMLIVTTATASAALIPATSEYATVALDLETIAEAGIQMHEQITGQPFDRTKLPDIAPV